MAKHNKQANKDTKFWDKDLDKNDTMMHKLYIDYNDKEKKKPCSIKFKTDMLDKIIELHEVKFDKPVPDVTQDIEAVRNEESKQNGCRKEVQLYNPDRKKDLYDLLL